MIAAGSLEYAHARIWARHGQRPDDGLWRRIEATRELATLLELARGSSLACWVAGVGPAADVHAIEAAVRRHWRERVAEVASWMAPAWSRAILWCGVLVDLPVLQHLARGGAALEWMTEDPQLRGLVDGSLPASAPLRTLLEAARAEPQRLLPLWRAAWQRCLPRTAGRDAVEDRLMPLLASHAAAFGGPQTVDGWALRRSLQTRLVLLLRRTLAEPATAFIYLALSALEFERVRGELLRRAAFPQRSPAP
ncbi:MAG: hypothetical protein IH627_05180 [Rubrivivax sp.]|nr:hypothetical protein [Rubrivivax sp.]